MKKLGIGLLIGIIMFGLVGCTGGNNSKDKSKSFICRIELGDKDNITYKEVVVSLDGEGKASTYISVEDSSYSDEAKYEADCNAKTKQEETYEAKNYENAQFYKTCDKDGLTVTGDYFFNLRNLSEEEKDLIKDIVKYIDEEGNFDGENWTKAMKKQKYNCQ